MTAGRQLRQGDIVLVMFPFTDLSGTKRRPAPIVGRVQSDDLLLAFITSPDARALGPSTHFLTPTDPEFPATGLKVPSWVRLDTVGSQTRTGVAGCLGYVLDL